ncbi:MAG: plasmid stabilization protein [Myxococcales bacterium]|nr:plasmid stabilization protein [Myxococcales bacterium]
MIVRLGPAAEAELQEAMAWYDARREGLGLLLLLAVSATLERIGRAPRSFTPAGPERRYRRALVGRFPYQLIFELANDEVRVLAVAHLRRQPGYWTGRT